MKIRINQIRLIMLILAFTNLFSCSTGNKKQDNAKDTALIYIQKEDMTEKKLFFTDYQSADCRFVPLETTDDCLMGYIKKVVASNNLLFIKDYNDKLFVFDSKGKFLNTIGEIGQWPDELLSFVDFYVNDEAKYVGIYDIYKNKMYRYAFDGTIIEKADCDPIIRGLAHIQGFNNGKLFFSMHNDMDNDFHYIVLNEKDCSLYKKVCLI